jgi:uncharacterized DUF497 family protein
MAPRGRRGRPRPQFEWDRANEEKLLLRHDVSALEAEQCFANPHTTRRAGREVYLLLGRTDEGRMLLLVYQQKRGGTVRVYSGREMTKRERRAYRRQVR